MAISENSINTFKEANMYSNQHFFVVFVHVSKNSLFVSLHLVW